MDWPIFCGNVKKRLEALESGDNGSGLPLIALDNETMAAISQNVGVLVETSDSVRAAIIAAAQTQKPAIVSMASNGESVSVIFTRNVRVDENNGELIPYFTGVFGPFAMELYAVSEGINAVGAKSA